MTQKSVSALIAEAVLSPQQESDDAENLSPIRDGISTPMPMEVSSGLDEDQIKLQFGDLPRQPSPEELQEVMRMSMQRAQVHQGCSMDEDMSLQVHLC